MRVSLRAMVAVVWAVAGFFLWQSLPAYAADNNVIIAQLQPGAADGASREFVSLFNTGDEPVDVTQWCLLYNTSTVRPGCIIPPDSQTSLWLQPDGFATFASPDFMIANPGFAPNAALVFSPGLADTGGQLTLYNAAKSIVDQMSWNKKAVTGNIYQHVTAVVPNSQLLTNIDSNGWGQTPLTLPPDDGLYEIVSPVYVCPNLGPGLTSIPEGYLVDEFGDCFEDKCPNLSGLQKTMPSDLYKNESGECMIVAAPLVLTEVLPNAAGSDTGKEFIEIYNASSSSVSLHNYRLFMGAMYERSFLFPESSDISPHSYIVFSDDDLRLTLPNTTTKLKLETIDGQLVSEMPAYNNMADDVAWALIDGSWQQTNRSTPGNDNVPWHEAAPGMGGGTPELITCPEGKYRHPETNRCRQISSEDDNLASCKPGQTRNPETNRCRASATTASALLTPCAPGQERNPDTNRCRKIGSNSTSLKPCPTGQERNPDTNRCRKKSGSLSAQAIDDQEASEATSSMGWVMIVGALIGFGGYGIWEWRSEIFRFLRTIFPIFGKSPPPD